MNNTTSSDQIGAATSQLHSSLAVVAVIVAIVAVVPLIGAVRIVLNGRKTEFPDAIYDIWIVFLTNRIVLCVVDLHTLGEFLTPQYLWIRNSFFCKQFLFYIHTVVVQSHAWLILCMCIYQYLVLFFPLKYFEWRGSVSFNRKVRLAIAIVVAWSCLITAFSQTGWNGGRCLYAYANILKPPGEAPFSIQVYVLLAAFYFLVLAITAVGYLLMGVVTYCKRSSFAKLTDQQRNVVLAQKKMALAGGVSFLLTYSSVGWIILSPETYYKSGFHIALNQTLRLMDRGADPLFMYWRNTQFRNKVNEILGFRSASKATTTMKSTKSTAK